MAMELTFHNANCDSVRVYKNDNGNEIYYHTLANDESVAETSAFGENWIFQEYVTGSWITASTYAVNKNYDHTFDITTRDVVVVNSGLTCDVTLYMEELDGANAGQVFDMGILVAGGTMTVKPASDRARIYGEVSTDVFTNELITDYDNNNENTGCYNLYLDQGCLALVEICNNNTDDDNDGLIDCDDLDCGGTTLSTSNNATLCAGFSETISAQAVGGDEPYIFSWSHGLGDGDYKVVNPSSSTTYTVTVTNANGCSDVGNITVTVNQSPVAEAGDAKTVCRYGETNLNATASGGVSPYNYSWSHAPGNGNNLTVTLINSESYVVTVTGDNGCIDTDTIDITVETCLEDCGDGVDNDNDDLVDCDDPDCGPTVDAGLDINICPGMDIEVTANATGGNGLLTYDWSNGFDGISQTVSPLVTTTYRVTVTAPSGCFFVDSVKVNLVPCTEDCTNGVDDDGDNLEDCDDPDCYLAAAPELADDEYTTCPSLPYSERVTYNDNNLQNATFNIVQHPANGSVTMDGTGKFFFTPAGNECTTETFIYEVCNAPSGCCSEATVTIHFNDGVAPILTNVPSDITISCDDIIPTPPNITAFDACPGIFVEFDETSDQFSGGACDAYTITRTWTATDLCNNSYAESQVITITDDTAPEIYQLYTLENGKRVIAGVSDKVSHEWKFIPFPISFGETPMVFTTVVTNNDQSAVTVRQRNPYSQGFEVRLMEEEGANGAHEFESIAWIAIEKGTNSDVLKLETERWDNVDHNPISLNFSNIFGSDPGILTAIQSTNEEEPANLRLNSTSGSSINAFVQEETSRDAELDHSLEHIGYLAFKPGEKLIDKRLGEFGETGKMSLTNAWTTVSLSRSYTEPVVVFGGISNNNSDGVNVRVRNLTENSFEVRLQEWDYLDGNHPTETVSWIVMEGSIPGNVDYYCYDKGTELKIGVNVFSVDNCDDQSTFNYNETTTVDPSGTVTTREWTTLDDCGNINQIIRHDTCATAALEIKAIIAGAAIHDGGTGLMRDDLRTDTLIPVEEPFSDLAAFPNVEDTTPEDNNGTGGGTNTTGGGGTSTPIDSTVMICHLPGTEHEVTLSIPQDALGVHLANGDVQGACTNPSFGVPAGVHTADYVSAQDGDWNDPATWAGGSVPPLPNVNAKDFGIGHVVTIQSGGITLQPASNMWIYDGGELIVKNGDFYVENAMLMAVNASIKVEAGMLKVWKVNSRLDFYKTTLTTENEFKIEDGTAWIENSCLTSNDKIHFHEADVVFRDVTAETNGEFHIHDGTWTTYFSKIKVNGGDFKNHGTVISEDLVIWVPEGDLENHLDDTDNGSNTGDASWTGDVQQFCISDSVDGLTDAFPSSQVCTGLDQYFNTCSSLEGNSNIGSGAGNGGGNYNYTDDVATICHSPGTIHEVTMYIPEAAIDLHVDNGDFVGGCDNTNIGAPLGAQTADYFTIADGNWDDPNTWYLGNVPPFPDVEGVGVAVNHNITYTDTYLKIKSGANLWVYGGGILTLETGHFKIFNADVLILNGGLNINNGNFDQQGYYADLGVFNSTLNCSGHFGLYGGAFWIESACMDVDANFEISGATGDLAFSSLIVQGHFTKSNLGTINLEHSKIQVETGNFTNAWFSGVNSDSLIIWAPNGHLTNGGLWFGNVKQYCIGGNKSGFWTQLPISEDCAGMPDYFATCSELLAPTIITETNVDTVYTEEEIALDGTIEPTLLVVEGEDAVVDWMLLEIRDLDSEDVLEYATVVLLRNGEIVSEEGTDIINFSNLPEGDYLVSLRHRNHLPMVADIPIYMNVNDPPMVDFTDPALPIRGAHLGGVLENGARRMWAGDFNEDDKVVYQGPNNDVFALFSRVLSDEGNPDYLANYLVRGYDHRDFNLDGNVIYQGPNNDRASLLYHSVLASPGNAGFLANFIVKGFLP